MPAKKRSVGVGRALRQFFWMDERLEAARKAGYGTADPGWAEYELCRSSMADASHLAESADGVPSALLLYRSVIGLLLRAQLARSGIDVAATAEDLECWRHLLELPLGRPVSSKLTDEQNHLMASSLGGNGLSYLAKLVPDKRHHAVQTYGKVAQLLAAPLDADAKRAGDVLLVRWARIIGALLLLGLGTGLLVNSIGSKPNFALHAAVRVVRPHPIWGLDSSLLVDGDRTNLGFHTVEGTNQYVIIDLGSVRAVSRVDVYNRADCCRERAVPLTVEVSKDGGKFRQVGKKTDVFDRWALQFSPVDARYVRLTCRKPNSQFHLAEVEVY